VNGLFLSYTKTFLGITGENKFLRNVTKQFKAKQLWFFLKVFMKRLAIILKLFGKY